MTDLKLAKNYLKTTFIEGELVVNAEYTPSFNDNKSNEKDARALVFLIDLSGSMSDKLNDNSSMTRRSLAIEAIKKLLKQCSVDTPVRIIGYDGHAEELLVGTSQEILEPEKLNTLTERFGGSTNILSIAEDACNITPIPDEAKPGLSFIVLTDGDDASLIGDRLQLVRQNISKKWDLEESSAHIVAVGIAEFNAKFTSAISNNTTIGVSNEADLLNAFSSLTSILGYRLPFSYELTVLQNGVEVYAKTVAENLAHLVPGGMFEVVSKLDASKPFSIVRRLTQGEDEVFSDRTEVNPKQLPLDVMLACEYSAKKMNEAIVNTELSNEQKRAKIASLFFYVRSLRKIESNTPEIAAFAQDIEKVIKDKYQVFATRNFSDAQHNIPMNCLLTSSSAALGNVSSNRLVSTLSSVPIQTGNLRDASDPNSLEYIIENEMENILCPVMHDIIFDKVVSLPLDNGKRAYYSKSALDAWVRSCKDRHAVVTNPLTRVRLNDGDIKDVTDEYRGKVCNDVMTKLCKKGEHQEAANKQLDNFQYHYGWKVKQKTKITHLPGMGLAQRIGLGYCLSVGDKRPRNSDLRLAPLAPHQQFQSGTGVSDKMKKVKFDVSNSGTGASKGATGQPSFLGQGPGPFFFTRQPSTFNVGAHGGSNSQNNPSLQGGVANSGGEGSSAPSNNAAPNLFAPQPSTSGLAQSGDTVENTRSPAPGHGYNPEEG